MDIFRWIASVAYAAQASANGRRIARNHVLHEPRRGPLGDTSSLPVPWTRIFSCPLNELAGKCLDITPFATPCRFRLLSLENLRLYGDFEIFEFPGLLEANPLGLCFTTVSYVWKGLPLDGNALSQRATSLGDFAVVGAEDADPISISLIKDVAWADSVIRSKDPPSRMTTFDGNPLNNSLVWLDQLCIMQTSPEDKAWQIRQMHNVYRLSHCLVLPGGLTRLASPEDATTWMSRAWTLQEVLAPDQSASAVLCQTNDEILAHYRSQGDQLHSARCEQLDEDKFIAIIPLLLFLKGGRSLEYYGCSAYAFEELLGARTLISSPNTIKASRDRYVWRSIWCRTSSRPVDMVLSIMQCFYASLDPTKFGKTERVKATIALEQEVSRNRRYRDERQIAPWIREPLLFFLPPAPELSIFPQFPETKVDGRSAMIRMPDGSLLPVAEAMLSNEDASAFRDVEQEHYSSRYTEEEWMDYDGYFWFIAGSVYMLAEAEGSEEGCLRAGDGSQWLLAGTLPDAGYRNLHTEEPVVYETPPEILGIEDRAYKAYLRRLDDIEGDVLAVFSFSTLDKQKGAYMLLRKHGPRRYHRFSYLVVDSDGKVDDPLGVRENSHVRQHVKIGVGPFPGYAATYEVDWNQVTSRTRKASWGCSIQ
ncbi:hypothetical protein BOTBODRAFT_145884 [Botryobasidium botryosum FD-172 SS1]|uniref:Heterokaryon incompatibility domain-containing protein n=1 Tax=Botryobasidium botryosum (strain FD-172 SS1) TaxID=930990 RepID=A0A067MH05_BOTB1|nr:hypothetical protein BOTBODRAFT_145884 [Botryobasidium botryosum FD-172 SS1]